MAICGGLTLASVVTCCTVAVAVASMVNELGSAVAGVFTELFGGLLSGLLQGIGAILLAMVFLLFAVFTVLMELLALLSTGQIIPFFMRLARLLGSI
jgi:hypothetical protein